MTQTKHINKKLKLKPETAKTGSRWTPEEVKQLLEEVKKILSSVQGRCWPSGLWAAEA